MHDCQLGEPELAVYPSMQSCALITQELELKLSCDRKPEDLVTH